MVFIIKNYNQYNLSAGAKYSICPICSKNRTKKNQKCMMLDWKTALGTCQHCGAVIQLHSYARSHENAGFRDNESQTKPTKSLTNHQTEVTKSSIEHQTIVKNALRIHQTSVIKNTYIDYTILTKSCNSFNDNNLFLYLLKLFGHIKAKELSEKYFLGTAKHWKGATVYWQLDRELNVRTGKIMLYDPISGKRIKQPYNHIAWVHKLIKVTDFNLEQCFFGEHLISAYKQIAIVESEKTAIIASAYIPQFTWLAVGSLNNLSANRCKVLEGKTITLYPDLNAYDKWKQKAKQIEKEINIKFIVSDLLETRAEAEDKKQGLDLADYLIKYDWRNENMVKDMKILDQFIDTNPKLMNFIEALDLEL